MAEQENGNPPKLSLSNTLALERTRAAYERTMMAWVRTGTSLITFGFAVYKFFEIETAGRDIGPRLIGSREFALVLIGIGLLSLVIGMIEHRRDLRVLGKDYPGMPLSGTRLIAMLIAALGALTLLVVIFRG